MLTARNLVATTSIVLGLGFCVALANAEDDPGASTKFDSSAAIGATTMSTTPLTVDQQQAGTAGSSVASQGPSTCHDSNGVIYNRGQAGYVRCRSEAGPGASQEAGVSGKAGAVGTSRSATDDQNRAAGPIGDPGTSVGVNNPGNGSSTTVGKNLPEVPQSEFGGTAPNAAMERAPEAPSGK